MLASDVRSDPVGRGGEAIASLLLETGSTDGFAISTAVMGGSGGSCVSNLPWTTRGLDTGVSGDAVGICWELVLGCSKNSAVNGDVRKSDS